MSIHKAVLLKEVAENLNLKKGQIVVDATLGGGGHSKEILKYIGSKGILIAIDRDIKAIKSFVGFPISELKRVSSFEIPVYKLRNAYLINSNFSNLDNILKILKISKVDAVLADLGLSSDQLKNKEMGFSFLKDAPLDMRMERKNSLTAEYIINNYSNKRLKKILKEYGGEKQAGKIAKEIIKTRRSKKIRTTFELVKIIENSVPKKYRRRAIHPATQTFQALRIEVNGELSNLKRFLSQAVKILKTGGRLAVISFHSGEDRIVKNILRENARGCICPPKFPVCRCEVSPRLKIITKKPLVPSVREIKKNVRSRSAKLRVAEKI